MASVPFKDVPKRLESWQTSVTLQCSLCERDQVVFRAEYDRYEGKKPVELISGFAWEITDSLRKKLGSAIKFFANGMFAVCHDCGKNRISTFERMTAREELPQIRATLFLASAARAHSAA